MAKGLKINLGEIDEIAKRYEPGAEVYSLLDDCNHIFDAVVEYYEENEAQVYEKQKAFIGTLKTSLRAINNNIDEISEGLNKYVEKMKEGDIVEFDADVFVAKDLAIIETSFANIETKWLEVG